MCVYVYVRAWHGIVDHSGSSSVQQRNTTIKLLVEGSNGRWNGAASTTGASVWQTDKGAEEREVIFAAIRKQLAKREQPFHLQRAKSDTYGR